MKSPTCFLNILFYLNAFFFISVSCYVLFQTLFLDVYYFLEISSQVKHSSESDNLTW